MEEVKQFYSKLKFPGPYTLEDLMYYDKEITNQYLKIYDDAVATSTNVLDVGCGSGFIINLLALRHPNVKFDAVDFSDAIDYAHGFSNSNNIRNVSYYKEDFLEWQSNKKYDLVICNGVLHHIPQHELALEKMKELTTKKLVIGIYNTYGKIFKKIFPVKYTNEILYLDQEECPFEISFTDKEFKSNFKEFHLVETVPGYKNRFVDLYNLANFANGGLTVYAFKLI